MNDLISRQAINDAMAQLLAGAYSKAEFKAIYNAWKRIKKLKPIEPQIILCKDCKYWNSGSCECPEHVVNCQDYMFGDIETKAEHFCGYAERRTDGQI